MNITVPGGNSIVTSQVPTHCFKCHIDLPSGTKIVRGVKNKTRVAWCLACGCDNNASQQLPDGVAARIQLPDGGSIEFPSVMAAADFYRQITKDTTIEDLAKAYVYAHWEDHESTKGTSSMDLDVEFSNLAYAIEEKFGPPPVPEGKEVL